jgi:CRISPR/Cas system CSM-associated protein Csm2 small subunit
VLALALALPAAVYVYPSTSWAGPSAEEEAALEEARDLFERGKAKYDTLDYVGAIELWQLAYAKVPASDAGVRNTMVYNIALAQEKQYEIDGDVSRLQHALKLLEVWMRDYKALYRPNDERIEEVNETKAKIAQLKAQIAAATGEEVADDEEKDEEPAEEEDEDEDEDEDEPPPTPEEIAKAEARRLIIAGYSVGGAGILFVAGGVAGIVLVPDPLVGRGGGGTLIGLGGALIVTGAVLLGIGYKKKKKVASGNYAVIPSPILGPGTAGAAVTVRF